MPLLIDTDIDSLVRTNIRGLIARAGGTVDQLIDYKRCVVEDINIPDGGFGKICGAGPSAGVRSVLTAMRKTVKQEVRFCMRGPRVPRDRKTIVMDMHQAHTAGVLQNKYDCSVSSNLIEHSPNSIWLLLNFYFITRKNGYQFHAIPNYRYTYDRFRTPTTLEHMIEDFENHADASDMSHVEDYRQSAIEKDGWQRRFHEEYPMEYPFIHFHVFDEHNTKALLEYVFEDVVVDVYKTDRFSDNVVFFRNSLNPRFSERHKGLLKDIGK